MLHKRDERGPGADAQQNRVDLLMPVALPASVEDTLDLLAAGHYVGERSLATALYLSLKLGRPLFLFTRDWPNEQALSFIDYLLHPQQGQKLGEESGFIPLY